MITFQLIADIYTRYLDTTLTDVNDDVVFDELEILIKSSIHLNKLIWEFEDVARVKERGFESIALAKEQIDINNQFRNDLIQKIDKEVFNREKVGLIKKGAISYSESPGMIIDRLAILFVKNYKMNRLINKISDESLKAEYAGKSQVVEEQISDLGFFFDMFFIGIRKGDVTFKIYDPIKVYNDERIRTFLISI